MQSIGQEAPDPPAVSLAPPKRDFARSRYGRERWFDFARSSRALQRAEA